MRSEAETAAANRAGGAIGEKSETESDAVNLAGGTAGIRSESAASLPERRLALSVQGLTYGFAGGPLLFDGLSFGAAEGEFVTLLAASGLGKTTLFRLLAGLLTPHSGVVRFGAEAAVRPQTEPSSLRPDQAASAGRKRAGGAGNAGRVAYMPQRDCLMPWRSVLDNAALGLELAGVPRREARRRARELLPAFGLAGAETKRPRELSGGMRQRVSFLRSMLAGGDVLLLDEPFSALDAMTRMEMQLWLLSVWERERKTILFVTHDIDEALLLSDRVLVASAAPVTALHEIPVALSRPRRYEDVLDGTFAEAKRQVLALLSRRDGGGAR